MIIFDGTLYYEKIKKRCSRNMSSDLKFEYHSSYTDLLKIIIYAFD